MAVKVTLIQWALIEEGVCAKPCAGRVVERDTAWLTRAAFTAADAERAWP